MRNLIWIFVACMIMSGAYLLYSGQTPRAAFNTAIEAVKSSSGKNLDGDGSDDF